MVLSCIMPRSVYCTGAQITYLGLLMKRTEKASCDEKVVIGSDWMLELAETEFCETFVPEWWMHTGGSSDFSVRSSWLYVTWTSCMTDGVFDCQTDKVSRPYAHFNCLSGLYAWPNLSTKRFHRDGKVGRVTTRRMKSKEKTKPQQNWLSKQHLMIEVCIIDNDNMGSGVHARGSGPEDSSGERQPRLACRGKLANRSLHWMIRLHPKGNHVIKFYHHAMRHAATWYRPGTSRPSTASCSVAW